jgi:hypothetical protein
MAGRESHMSKGKRFKGRVMMALVLPGPMIPRWTRICKRKKKKKKKFPGPRREGSSEKRHHSWNGG